MSSFRTRNFGRSGMTMVEAMIASLVLSLVMILAWNMFTSGARSAELAAWHTKCQQQLRNGLKALRDDIGHASYPSVIGPTEVAITRDGHHFRYHPAKVELTESTPEIPLLDFWICRPKREGFGDSENDPGEKIHATLRTRGNTVVYKKEGSANAALNTDRVLFDEVDYVLLEGPASTQPEEVTTIAIEVKTIHKHWKQSGVVERTMPKVEVQVLGDL